jgi:ribonuclease D
MGAAQPTDDAGLYVDSPESLAQFVERLAGSDWFAIDTEFLRERTYYPRLCLIQIATPDIIGCVDPLAIDDLSPLYGLLQNPAVTKVMHACSQDLEVLYQLTGQMPTPLFDTQLAAPLLGYPDQIGYANLVQEVLGVRLEKGHARTDWSLRPLDAKQIAYALDDVRYLAPLYQEVHARLETAGRLRWLDEDFRRYTAVERYRQSPDDAWRRIKGVDRLRPASLAVLQALAGWRERMAQQKNRPRNWILRDDLLLEIARRRPESQEALRKIRDIPERTLNRLGDELIHLVSEAGTRQPEPLPKAGREGRPTPAQEALADLLLAYLTVLADQQSINPSSLATRRQLLALVRGDRDVPLLHGWRNELAGRELTALLAGERVLAVKDGVVTARDT